VGDPEPRAAQAQREIEAATEACEKAMEDYRAGRVTASAVNRCTDRLGQAHYRAYVVSGGRIDDFRN
jgi:hypothetical protein